MPPSAITAEHMGSAARYDPQLHIPARPRQRRGLVVEVEPDQVVVTGGPKRQMFRGRSATGMLPRLLERLDGRLDHAELAAALDVTESSVFKVVSLLWTCGVVEEGPRAQDVGGTSERLADFLSRIGDATGANASWEQAAGRLAAAPVEVHGNPGLAAVVCDEFEPPADVAVGSGTTPGPDATLVLSVVCGEDETADCSALAAACWDRGIPFLRLRLDGRTAELGPYVDRSTTPCLDCLTAGEQWEDSAPTTADAALAGALFVRDVFALVSRTTTSPLPMRRHRVDLHTLSATEVSSATRPGCPRCSVADGPVAPEPSLAARFEAGVAVPPKAFLDLKAHQMHYKPSNLALQRRFKTWPVAPRVALPEPAYDQLASPTGTAPRPGDGPPVTLQALSLLLTMTAGTRGTADDRVQRWTASGGNIGSVTAYLVVRDCQGLPAGRYAYVAPEHELAWLGGDLAGVPGSAPVTLVLTGDYAKVAQKYAAFALRIVFLDSGCAQTTARLVAEAAGVPLSSCAQWDDEAVSAALLVDPDVEPVTAVLQLGVMP